MDEDRSQVWAERIARMVAWGGIAGGFVARIIWPLATAPGVYRYNTWRGDVSFLVLSVGINAYLETEERARWVQFVMGVAWLGCIAVAPLLSR